MTKKEKLKCIDYILKDMKDVCYNQFICCSFTDFDETEARLSGDEDVMKNKFPELHNLVMTIGKRLHRNFKWGWAWTPNPEDNQIGNKFKTEQLLKLKKKIQ